MSEAKYQENTTMRYFLIPTNRECHRYHLLSDWSELAYSLSERSSSENRTLSPGVIQVRAILRLSWLPVTILSSPGDTCSR